MANNAATDDLDQTVLNCLQNSEPLTQDVISERTGVDPADVRVSIGRLVDIGAVRITLDWRYTNTEHSS